MQVGVKSLYTMRAYFGLIFLLTLPHAGAAFVPLALATPRQHLVGV